MNDDKKVTIRDVARFAGVSIATVSYIMNDRQDLKIKEETRKKVKQAANILNYVPSHTARSLATGNNDILGVAYRLNPKAPARNAEIMHFVNLLIEKLSRLKYCIAFIPLTDDKDHTYQDMNILHNVSGIIVIDLPDSQFHDFADYFYVPVIGVDMLINDFLFYQIYSDFPVSIKKAVSMSGDDYFIIMDAFYNQAYMNYLTKDIPAEKLLLYSQDILSVLQTKSAKKYIILGTQLALFLRPYLNPFDMIVIATGNEATCLFDIPNIISMDIEKKANLSVNILLNGIERKFSMSHDFPVGE